MKAFSADVLTVTDDQLLKESYFNLEKPDKKTYIQSRTDQIYTENDLYRDYYKNLFDVGENTVDASVFESGIDIINSICAYLKAAILETKFVSQNFYDKISAYYDYLCDMDNNEKYAAIIHINNDNLEQNESLASATVDKIDMIMNKTREIGSAFDDKISQAINLIRDIKEAYDYSVCDYRTTDILAVEESATDTDTSDEAMPASFIFGDVDEINDRFNLFMSNIEHQAINQEALLFVNSESDRAIFEGLVSINEAIGDKVKKAYFNTIAAIKKIFNKFIEKLMQNFGTTKAYLDKYKDIILNKPFKDDEFRTQNLAKGIERIEERSKVPTLDLQLMANNEMADEGNFFRKVVAKDFKGLDGTDSKTINDVQNAAGISAWCKSYFCMQNHEMTYHGKDIQARIKFYYDFLYDVRNIEKDIKEAIKNIERNVKSILKQAGKDVENTDQQNNQTANATGAENLGGDKFNDVKEESVAYSYLYQKFFTLNENGVLTEVEVVNRDASGDQVNNGRSTTTHTTIGQDNSEANSKTARASNRNTVDNFCRVYSNVCTAVLKAKMSAVEFHRNELMQIIRIHVGHYIGNTGGEQQANNQQQQEKK